MQKQPDSHQIRIFTLIKNIFFLLRPLSHLETIFFIFFAYFCNKKIQKYVCKYAFSQILCLEQFSRYCRLKHTENFFLIRFFFSEDFFWLTCFNFKLNLLLRYRLNTNYIASKNARKSRGVRTPLFDKKNWVFFTVRIC